MNENRPTAAAAEFITTTRQRGTGENKSTSRAALPSSSHLPRGQHAHARPWALPLTSPSPSPSPSPSLTLRPRTRPVGSKLSSDPRNPSSIKARCRPRVQPMIRQRRQRRPTSMTTCASACHDALLHLLSHRNFTLRRVPRACYTHAWSVAVVALTWRPRPRRRRRNAETTHQLPQHSSPLILTNHPEILNRRSGQLLTHGLVGFERASSTRCAILDTAGQRRYLRRIHL